MVVYLPRLGPMIRRLVVVAILDCWRMNFEDRGSIEFVEIDIATSANVIV